ncbi:hypothetical protein ACLSU7_03650 [Bdellovibrio sp. HCB185ZH]|uniref:hypothetical protein n=1 Tax=Bdellovibrio sp. HCB185ZH TaxID=3394235 RepID=UPI0039A68283
MKFILILEDDERTSQDLYESLKSIDPQLHIRFFKGLASFHEFLKVAVHEGAKALAQAGTKHPSDLSDLTEPSIADELRLVIAKDEFLGTQNMGLVRRARDFFIRKKMCSEQEPTALILTAFESPTFDIKLAEDRIINNVLYKPFDKLIIKEHLQYALTGHHPVTSSTLTAAKMSATIEMLKDIQLQSLSEIGFTSLNNHEIKIGAITKYYSDSFTSDSKKSLLAVCVACKEISIKEYLCTFQFVAADPGQIAKIRRDILQNKSHQSLDLQTPMGNLKTRIILLNDDEPLDIEFKTMLNQRFQNVEVFSYKSQGQLLSDLQDLDSKERQNPPLNPDLVIINYHMLDIEKEKTWNALVEKMKDRAKKHSTEWKETPQLIILSRTKITPPEVADMSRWCKDIYFTPLDKMYIAKKLITNFAITTVEPTTLPYVKDVLDAKVANPVEITQISEAGVVMKYHRAISTGAFREFILWRMEEHQNPEIIATVNYSEENKTDSGYLNHFVFFGMKDAYLKHIRLWLVDAYIKSKEKDSA